MTPPRAIVYRISARLEDETIIIDSVACLNREAEGLLGWSEHEIAQNPAGFLEKVHPEDAPRVREGLRCLFLGVDELRHRYRYRRKDGTYLVVLETLNVTHRAGTRLEWISVWQEASWVQERAEILEALDRAPGVAVVLFRDTFVYANEAAQQLLGYTREELLRLRPEEVLPEELWEAARAFIAEEAYAKGFELLSQELPLRTARGERRDVLVFARTVTYQGRPTGLAIAIDQTQRKRYERLYRLLKDVNARVESAEDQTAFLRAVCALLVERGGLGLAWVAVPEEGTGEFRAVAAAGRAEGFLDRVRVTVDPEVPEGRDPIGTAWREQRIVVVADTRTDPAVTPWREIMLERGFLSVCAVPVLREGRTVAVLALYAGARGFFTEEEIDFLEELQRVLSAALEDIEAEQHRRVIERAVEASPDWIVVTDAEGGIVYVNDAVCRISGYAREELLGRKMSIFRSGYHDPGFYAKLWEAVRAGRSFQAVFVNRRKDGKRFYLDQTIVPVMRNGAVHRIVGVAKDVTVERHLQEEVVLLRYQDPLTHLLNREGFLLEVEGELREREGSKALLLADVHQFTHVNRAFGARFGDALLYTLGQRLRERVARLGGGLVGRVGEDAFGVLLPGVEPSAIEAVLPHIFEAFTEPFEWNGETLSLGVHVGVAFSPRDATSAHELYNKAATALNFSKRKGGENTFSLFDQEMDARALRYLGWRAQLEQSLKEDRFELYFQPYFYTDTRTLAGAEALLRLRDPQKGLLAPSAFIEVLEESPLITAVEMAMLEKIRAFLLSLERPIKISFNISPKSLTNARFLEAIQAISRDVGRYLVLEVTERLLVEEAERARVFLEEVRKLGVRVAVDDFGTGYSSLAYLERLPVDFLKIDMSFVQRMTQSRRSLAIVDTLVSLAMKLGLKTIAEGVETEEEYKLLALLGCDIVQGYYLAKPMPREALEALLSDTASV
ncbi:sensor domain-containing protein [Marinithermus hydrothermalis]|uniref:Diguanylate cyclase/phosphodiesterase with PAS/PAC and GAF sensor(S) n=1 Tax=Marinithermus hydrothermalis (strain DSM 14884 / JCM 11576 / T1) TaxID=869210 RepID=F2NK56_MARHT|nr:EAL domain-containing protein [Marinithermus hydrothermalis]AEB12027.1 diguanylate cyclase/phosphodiesterase with PAS/PAC and GAF sensor(s) [Marinithermus hydrothermalis DSM 14884]